MRKPTTQETIDADATLRKYCTPGTRLWTINRHTSASGMTRYLDVYVIIDNRPLRLTWSVGACLGLSYNDKHGALTVQGCGMDMGFHLIYGLSATLFLGADGVAPGREGYVLTHEWL